MLFPLSLSVFLLTFCHWTSAQVPFPHNCPEVKIIENFKLDDYMGIWYEKFRYFAIFEFLQKCVKAQLVNTNDGFVSVTNTGVSKFTGTTLSITGRGKIHGSGQIGMVFPTSPDQGYDKPNYLVLGTDYTTFALVYSCTDYTPVARTDYTPVVHTKNVWILTRSPNPSAAAIASAKQVMDDNNLPKGILIETKQEGCSTTTTTLTSDPNLTGSADQTVVTAEAAAPAVNVNAE